MSGILDLLNSSQGKSIIDGIAGQTGQDQGQTGKILSMALPVMMQAMRQNTASEEGAAGLQKALNDKHDGSILDDLGGFFAGGVDAGVLEDGGKILGHVLGGKQQNVEKALSKKSGVDAGDIGQILKVAAPLVMGMLGKQSRQESANDGGGIQAMLGGLLSGNSPETEQSFLTSILDADGDGSVIDDVAGMVLGGGKKKGGLGGMLGNILGK